MTPPPGATIIFERCELCRDKLESCESCTAKCRDAIAANFPNPTQRYSHRCESMEHMERVGELLQGNTGLAQAPRTLTITRFRGPPARPGWGDETAWLLQLCTGTVSVLVFVRCCPFCGEPLPR